MKRKKILFIGSDGSFGQLICLHLADEGLDARPVFDLDAARLAAAQEDYDLFLVAGLDGPEAAGPGRRPAGASTGEAGGEAGADFGFIPERTPVLAIIEIDGDRRWAARLKTRRPNAVIVSLRVDEILWAVRQAMEAGK